MLKSYILFLHLLGAEITKEYARDAAIFLKKCERIPATLVVGGFTTFSLL